MLGNEILKRFENLYAIRKGSIEQTWDLIERYISPMRSGRFYSPQQSELEIRSRRPEIWDLTAIRGLSVLVASMQGAFIPQNVAWFNLMFLDEKLEDNKEAKTWLDECSDILYDQISDSNFNTEVASCFTDLGAFGNSCLILETEDETEWRGPAFQSLPLREWYFEMDFMGEPKNFYRFLQWTPFQIVSKWGNTPEDRATLPPWVIQRAESGEGSNNKVDLIFCIYRRTDEAGRPIKEPGDQTTMKPELRPWGFKYVLRGQGDGGNAPGGGELGHEGGYYRMPVMVTRWEKLSGSEWGFGPGNIALPTVMYLNAWMETEKAAAEKAVDPPIMSTERGLLSPPDLRPGGMNVVRTMDDMKAFENKANFPVAYNTLTELRGMVNDVFKVEDLKLKESPAMTALEVQARMDMMLRVLGPPAARIHRHLLRPALRNTFHMMTRYKQFPKPPGIVQDNKRGFEIEYQGPLMKAQRAQDVAQMERLAGIAMNMVKVFPEVSFVFDPVAFVRVAAEKLSVPLSVLNDERTVAAKEQQMEQDKNLQRQQVGADVMQKRAAAQSSALEAQQLNTGAAQIEGSA